jgi:hypothetical protein
LPYLVKFDPDQAWAMLKCIKKRPGINRSVFV